MKYLISGFLAVAFLEAGIDASEGAGFILLANLFYTLAAALGIYTTVKIIVE